MELEEKPPLGLVPKSLWQEQRLYDIEQAIKRYMGTLYPIPREWLDERDELIDLIRDRNVNGSTT